ncbi:MAG: hypothetical protein AAB963_00840 [Patescibacteria group bacterium]
MQIKSYKTKNRRLSGTRYEDVYDKAYALYVKIRRRTKRRPYLRSAYFKKSKIFLELFWRHLDQKNWRDRARRMRYLPCAFEIIQFSRLNPESKENPNDHSEILHRFYGITKEGQIFYVQIKEEKKTGEKWFISVFPETD